MTSVLTRLLPGASAPEDADDPRTTGWLGTVLSGLLAALAAVLAGLVVLGALVGTGWLLEPAAGGSIGGPARVTVQSWLLAHGGSLSIGGVVLGVVPLGLSLVAAACCWFAAGWAVRRTGSQTLRELGETLAAFVLTYATAALLLTLIATADDAEVATLRSGIGAALLAAVAGGAGMLKVTGHGRLLHDVLPMPSRACSAGALAGLWVLLAAGAVMVAVATFADRAGFARLLEGLAPGWPGGLAVLAVCLLLIPNAVFYAVAVLIGPGFAIGAQTVISAFDISLGPVPGLPLVAALPDRPAVPLALLAALAVPVLAGGLVGAVVERRLREDEVGIAQTAGWAAVGAVGTALLVGVGQLVAAGSLGPETLAVIGAPVFLTAAVAVPMLALPAAAVAAVQAWRHR